MLEKFPSVSPNRPSLSKLDATKVANFLEASPNEVYIVDQKTLKIEYANPRATQNLGYSLAALQQMTVLDLTTELNGDDLKELTLPLVNREVTQINLETTHGRADGSTYPVEVYLQLVKEEEQLYFFAIVVDISKPKNTEKSLQNKTKELASIANNIPGVIYRLRYFQDGTVKVEYVSDRAEEILGISLQEIYADFNHFLNLVHHDDLPSLNEIRKRTLSDASPFHWEGRMMTPSRGIIWIQVRSESQLQADGSVLRHGVLLDITTQKQTELALQKSEEKFRQFAENIDDVFWMIDTEMTRLVYASPGFEKIWGHSRQDLIANPRHFLNWIHPEDRATVKEAIPKQVLGEYDLEYRIIRPDGEMRWLRDRAFPVRNEQGKVYRVAGIAQDITEQKSAATELSRNRELKEAIFDEATDALFLIEPQDLTVIDCNRRAVELAAASDKAAIIVKEADCLYQTPFSTIKKVLNQQGVWNEEVIVTNFKKQQFYGDVVWKQIEVAGKTLFLVRLTDISERKAFEAELKTTNECLELTNQELARATRLKDEFLASMSHELRTPLNAILGMSEGLTEGLFQTISEQQKQAVKTINTSANHLLALINDILDLAKIQAHQIQLNFTEVNLNALCESSLTFVQQDALRKKIQLHTQIETSCLQVNVDELRMRQILINLLSNAVKFTPEKGQVTLKVTENPTQETLMFAVIDNGIGIPNDRIDDLFEPFVQLDSQLNRQYSGTGLGLSLVRRLTELHGGTVEVDSQVGSGSCFAVKLPYSEICRVPNQSRYTFYFQSITDSSTLPSILLINSDRANLDTMSSYLEAYGYNVVAVEEQEAIFAAIENFTPNLIVIDLYHFEQVETMIVQQLHQHPKCQQAPIIAITDEATSHLETELSAFGVSYCIGRPIRLRHLLNQIQNLLPEEFQP